MIDWLNNLHPTVNALIVVLGSTTALLTLAAALRSRWRACRKLFRRRPVDPNRVERNKRMLERAKPRLRQPTGKRTTKVFAFEDGPDLRKLYPLEIGPGIGKSPEEKSQLNEVQAAAQKRIMDEWAKTIMKHHKPMFIGVDYGHAPLWEEKKIILTST